MYFAGNYFAMWGVFVAILVVVIGSIIVIIKVIPAGELDAWVKVTTVLGAVITGFSLLWAAYTYYKGEILQREVSAYGIYEESMRLSIEHPDFANPRLAPKAPGTDTSAAERMRYEQYRWYVGQALYGFELILEVYPDDDA